MAGIDKEERDRIGAELVGRGVNQPCPRCAARSFSVAEGYFTNALQQDLGTVMIGGVSIPTAVVVCTNCGYLMQHALGVLGLLPTRQSPKSGTTSHD